MNIKCRKNDKRQQRIFSAVFLNSFADKKLVHHFLSANDPEEVALFKNEGSIRIEMGIITSFQTQCQTIDVTEIGTFFEGGAAERRMFVDSASHNRNKLRCPVWDRLKTDAGFAGYLLPVAGSAYHRTGLPAQNCAAAWAYLLKAAGNLHR